MMKLNELFVLGWHPEKGGLQIETMANMLAMNQDAFARQDLSRMYIPIGVYPSFMQAQADLPAAKRRVRAGKQPE